MIPKYELLTGTLAQAYAQIKKRNPSSEATLTQMQGIELYLQDWDVEKFEGECIKSQAMSCAASELARQKKALPMWIVFLGLLVLFIITRIINIVEMTFVSYAVIAITSFWGMIRCLFIKIPFFDEEWKKASSQKNGNVMYALQALDIRRQTEKTTHNSIGFAFIFFVILVNIMYLIHV